jgi:hypothetical protein
MTTTPTWTYSPGTWITPDAKQVATWSNLNIASNANMTISFWINITATSGSWRNIFHITNNNNNCCNSGDRVPAAWIVPNTTSILIINSTSANGNSNFSTKNIPANTKTFVTITWSGVTVNVYFNGILNTTYKHSGTLIATIANANVYITDTWHDTPAGFQIKDFKTYNSALSQSNVTYIYNQTSNISSQYIMSTTELLCYKQRYPDLSNMSNVQLQTHWSTIGYAQQRNNQCSAPQVSSGTYNFKGCYNDTSVRAIPTNQGNVSNVDQCQKIATTKQQQVFGLQNNGQCWTGNNEQQAYQYGLNYNGSACGNLGGSMTNMVYVSGKPYPSPAPPVPILSSVNFIAEHFSNNDSMHINNSKYFFIMIIIIIFFLLFYYMAK